MDFTRLADGRCPKCNRPLQKENHCIECEIYWGIQDHEVLEALSKGLNFSAPDVKARHLDPTETFVCRIALTPTHQKWLYEHADPGCEACFGLGYYTSRTGNLEFCKCVKHEDDEGEEECQF